MEWWKARDILWKLFLIVLIFGLFILFFPNFPVYIFTREQVLNSRNVELLALFATLLGFSIAISYLDKIFRKVSDQEKKIEYLEDSVEEERLNRQLKEKQQKSIEMAINEEDTSSIKSINNEINELKKQITDIQERQSRKRGKVENVKKTDHVTEE
jgi:hypothetical protein